MPRFSVVVPVHGTEQFLAQCLASVLGQPDVDLEVVAVDDASPDGSAAVLAAAAVADARLRVLTLPHNVGLGPARQAGIEACTGEYLVLLDSDDLLADGALAAVDAALAAAADPDVLLVGFTRFGDGPDRADGSTAVLAELAGRRLTAVDAPELLQVFHVAWNRVVRLDLLRRERIEFPPGWYEDVPWSIPALLAAGSVACTPTAVVRYRQRPGSILRSRGARHLEVVGQWQRLADWAAGDPRWQRWRVPLAALEIDHLLTVLGAPGRMGPADRRRFFAAVGVVVRTRTDELGVELDAALARWRTARRLQVALVRHRLAAGYLMLALVWRALGRSTA